MIQNRNLQVNNLEWKGNCSDTLEDGTLAVDVSAVAFCMARRGLGGATAPSSLYQMWHPTHQRPVYQSPYCCIMACCSAVL